MSENLARCRRCHDVFDPDAGICPRCGTPWEPIAAPPPPEEGTYADRYRGTQFGEPEPQAVVMAPPSNKPLLLIGAGVAAISLALVGALVISMGVFGESNAPVIVSLVPPTVAPPTPTPRPEMAMALDALNDPKLNAHIVIQNRVDEDSVITGHPYTSATTMDVPGFER